MSDRWKILLATAVIVICASMAATAEAEEVDQVSPSDDFAHLEFGIVQSDFNGFLRDLSAYQSSMPPWTISLYSIVGPLDTLCYSRDGSMRVLLIEDGRYLHFLSSWAVENSITPNGGEHEIHLIKEPEQRAYNIQPVLAIAYEIDEYMHVALVLPNGLQVSRGDGAKVKAGRFLFANVGNDSGLRKLVGIPAVDKPNNGELLFDTLSTEDSHVPGGTMRRARWLLFSGRGASERARMVLGGAFERKAIEPVFWRGHNGLQDLPEESYIFHSWEDPSVFMIDIDSVPPGIRLATKEAVEALATWDSLLIGVFDLRCGGYQIVVFEAQ